MLFQDITVLGLLDDVISIPAGSKIRKMLLTGKRPEIDIVDTEAR